MIYSRVEVAREKAFADGRRCSVSAVFCNN